MAKRSQAELVPVKLVRQRAKGKRGAAAKLWVKEPESQAEDPSLLAARLCSCSDVCLAVIEDR